MKQLTQDSVRKILDLLFEQVKSGVANMDSAEQLADQYRQSYSNIDEAVDKLITTETLKAAGVGFITGLGGIAFMPVSLPANLYSVLYIQMRLVTAIALLKGMIINEPKLKIIVFCCLCGEAFKLSITRLLCNKLIVESSQYSMNVLLLNVSKHLTTQLVSQSAKGLSKYIPFLGSMISGFVDYAFTRTVGEFAKKAMTV